MNYAIQILQREIKIIERNVRVKRLMETDMKKATNELHKVKQIKKAIKVLKQKRMKEAYKN